MPTKRFLTASEVAELLQLNTETVYSLIAKGDLPALKVGKQWRFDGEELNVWITNSSVNRQSDKLQPLPRSSVPHNVDHAAYVPSGGESRA